MSLSEVEASITSLVTDGVPPPGIQRSCGGGGDSDKLFVIKYLPARFLSGVLSTQRLFASATPGHTWGDAVYVAPIECPLTTMMYGAAGVVGWLSASGMRFFDATNPKSLALYQEWISYFSDLFRQLTTTVHANQANRELRNKFRSRFGIGCVLFRPDEPCPSYVDSDQDSWLALTHWNTAGLVGYGPSQAVRDLRWCAIGTDSFEPDGLGFRAFLHPSLSKERHFVKANYEKLDADLRAAYAASDQVLITEF